MTQKKEKGQIFSSIPVPVLVKCIRTAFKEEIAEIIDQQSYEPLIRSGEACQILGITRVTLLDWRKKGIVPFHKFNSRIYFKKSELLAAMEHVPNRKGRRK